MVKTCSEAALSDRGMREAAECDAEPLSQCRNVSTVFTRIADATRGQYGQKLTPRSGRPPATDVDGNGVRFVTDSESLGPSTSTEILVLAIHEEALVEPLKLFQKRAADDEACPRQPLGSVSRAIRFWLSYHFIGPEGRAPDSV